MCLKAVSAYHPVAHNALRVITGMKPIVMLIEDDIECFIMRSEVTTKYSQVDLNGQTAACEEPFYQRKVDLQVSRV